MKKILKIFFLILFSSLNFLFGMDSLIYFRKFTLSDNTLLLSNPKAGITNEDALELLDILRDPRITSLQFACCPGLSVLPDLRPFTNLKNVCFDFYGISVDEVENKLPVSIESMNFDKSRFVRREEDQSFINFSRFVALRYLSLCRSDLTSNDLREGSLPVSLENLDISHCDLREGMPNITNLVNLRELNLAGSKVPVLSLSRRTLPANIEVLNLTGCDFWPEYLFAEGEYFSMPDLRWLANLRVLDIVCTEFSSRLCKHCSNFGRGEEAAGVLFNAANRENRTTEHVQELFRFLNDLGVLVLVV
jgi:Leucine-rich repeat (LRR) protein